MAIKPFYADSAPASLPPSPPALRGRLHSRFMFSAAGTSQASTQRQDGTESSFPSLWLLFHVASGDNRQAATPAAAVSREGTQPQSMTSNMTQSTLWSPRRSLAMVWPHLRVAQRAGLLSIGKRSLVVNDAQEGGQFEKYLPTK